MFATAITNASNFFHFAAVFIYANMPIILAVLFALVVINFVRVRMVAARRRRVMKRRAAAQKSAPAIAKRSFDPFAPIKF